MLGPHTLKVKIAAILEWAYPRFMAWGSVEKVTVFYSLECFICDDSGGIPIVVLIWLVIVGHL